MIFHVQTVSKTLTYPDNYLSFFSAEEQDSEEPLLSDSDSTPERLSTNRQSAVTIPQLLASPELRRPLLTIVFIMTSQQISGINAGKQSSSCTI
jgi:hypothetical protein